MFNVPTSTLNFERETLNRAEGATLNIEPRAGFTAPPIDNSGALPQS